MNKINISFVLLIISFSSNNCFAEQQVPLPLIHANSINLPGTVISSLLKPEQFAELMNDKAFKIWVLADGREVGSDSKYAKYVQTKCLARASETKFCVPDMTNKFLRGIAADSGRQVGSLEQQATNLPKNIKVSISEGAHQHSVINTAHSSHSGGNSGRGSHLGALTTRNTSGSGSHVHTVTITGGDDETRPVNIGVYYYIKIN